MRGWSRSLMTRGAVVAVALAMPAAAAVEGTVGDLRLLGLARDVAWPQAPAGYGYTVVCDIAVDAKLPVRSTAAADGAVVQRLPRFATLEVDTRARQGGWVRVVGADLSFTPEGHRRPYTSVLVEGWAADDHLCGFEP